jgi:hypothetical protein
VPHSDPSDSTTPEWSLYSEEFADENDSADRRYQGLKMAVVFIVEYLPDR